MAMTDDQRSCGSCTACCEGWLRASFRDVTLCLGGACPHLIDGTGCGIYEDRPQDPCRDFACGWLKAPELIDEDLKPDRCGAIAIVGRKWQGWKVIRIIPTGETVPEATLERFKALARDTNTPLFIVSFGKRDGEWIQKRELGRAYGPPRFVEAVRAALSSEATNKEGDPEDSNVMGA
jgi:hypothetical protein